MMTFNELYRLLVERKRTLPEGSGTTVLLKGGLLKILPKLNEETFEVGLALESEGPDEVALETSQCFYYCVCLAVFLEIPFEQLRLSPSEEILFDDEHDLAKHLARRSALLCHEPGVLSINALTPLLFEALRLKNSSLEKMFSLL